MIVDVGNLNCQLRVATSEEREFVEEYLSFRNPKAHFSGGPPKTRMFNPLSGMFPAGFLRGMRKAAAEENIRVDVQDRRTPPKGAVPAIDSWEKRLLFVRSVIEIGNDCWLRDYQLEAVARVTERERGIIKVPTGGGKTEIAVGCSLVLPIRWLFLVHRTSLMEQAADRYEARTGLPSGRVGEGRWHTPLDADFIAVTFQTLAAKLAARDQRAVDLLLWTQGLIVDECHVLPADSFWRVAMSTPNAFYRVGLSGTPLARGDQRSQLSVAALGPVIYTIKPQVLQDAGVLAKPRIHMIEVKQSSVKKSWNDVYAEAIVKSPRRNAVVIEAAKRATQHGSVLVFVKNIDHGKILEKMFWSSGLRPAFVWGTHSVEARQRAVRDMVAGRTDVLICSVVFQEGIDIPSLRSVVVASGGKSVIAALQRIGRGMRVDAKSGKTTFDVYDIADRGCGCAAAAKVLGTPGLGLHSGCEWLEKHTKKRMRAYAGEGHSTTMEQWVVSAPSRIVSSGGGSAP